MPPFDKIRLKSQSDIIKRFDIIIQVFFWIQVVMVALWGFQDPLPPLQDYPNQVANAFIIVKLSGSAFFQHYYYLNFFPNPYILEDLILSLLMLIGGSDFAAKAFIVLALIAVPAGMYFFIKQFAPDKIYLCYFSLPLIWNKPFFKGNCNFILGIALAFATLGLLWKLMQSERDRKTFVMVAVGALLVYLTHLIAFYLFIFTALVFVGLHCFRRKNAKRAVLLLAFIPAIMLLLVNMARAPVLYSNLDLFGQIFSLKNIQGKFGEIGSRLLCFSAEEARILAPFWIGLLLMILAGLPQVRYNPFPFVLCGLLFALYILTPREIQIMIRPHERVLVFMTFLLPLCCLNRRYLIMEKIFAVILCTITFFQISDYYTRISAQLTPSMSQARTMLKELPEKKKLMAIWAQWPGFGQIGYAQCVQAYYAMDREGYVATLYTQDYFVVRQKNALRYSTYPKDLTTELLQPYDFLFIWGRDPGVEGFVRQSGFVPRKESDNMSIYEKAAGNGPG